MLLIKVCMRNLDLIEEIKKFLKRVAPSSSAILFGSRARGDSHADSDIDLLILLDKDKINYEDETKITDPLYDFEFSSGMMISPIVMTRKDWEDAKYRTTLYDEVLKDGLQLL